MLKVGLTVKKKIENYVKKFSFLAIEGKKRQLTAPL